MEKTSKTIANEYRAASKREMKKVLRNKTTAIAALVRTGILTADGKKLAKPYR